MEKKSKKTLISLALAVVLSISIYNFLTMFTVVFTHNSNPGSDEVISSLAPEKSTIKKFKIDSILKNATKTDLKPEENRQFDWSVDSITLFDYRTRAEVFLNSDGSSIFRLYTEDEQGDQYYALTKEQTKQLLAIAPEEKTSTS